MSFFSDLWYKFRLLLDGEAPGGNDDEDEEEEVEYSRRRTQNVQEEEDYFAPEEYDEEESASSLTMRMADEFIDEDDEYFDEQPEPTYARAYAEEEEDDFGARPEVIRLDTAKEEPRPLPNRTEVTLNEIARLSQKLDEATMEEYKRRIIKLKQETGAVSALAALRILHEYVDDDTVDADTSDYPSLLAD